MKLYNDVTVSIPTIELGESTILCKSIDTLQENYSTKVMPMMAKELCVEEETKVLSQTDFVIPLKEEGMCLRAVIEQLFSYYNPRRLIIVSRPSVLDRVSRLVQFWDISERNRWKILFVNELTLFDPTLGENSIDKLKSIYDGAEGNLLLPELNTVIQKREFGWWYQQIIKLGLATTICDLSRYYVVWDSDLIPLKRWPLFMLNTELGGSSSGTNNVLPTIAILQKSGKKGASDLYFQTLKLSLGIDPLSPESGGTFVTHHMVFDTDILNQFLDRISSNCGNLPWPIAIMNISRQHLRWSEYLCYASFACKQKGLNFHPLKEFGENGTRIRNGGFAQILLDYSEKAVPLGGFSLDTIQDISARLYGNGVTGKLQSYVQVDHVYGEVPGSNSPRGLPLVYPRSKWSSEEYCISNTWSYELFYAKQGNMLEVLDPQLQMEVVQRIQHWWKIFLKHKSIFVHVPKNAGTFIESLLEPILKEPKSQHVTALEIREMWPSKFHELPKFAIYRDPISRFISAYVYLYDGGNEQIGDMYWSKVIKMCPSFSTFVKNMFVGKTEHGTDNFQIDWNTTSMPVHFLPQYFFICDTEGKILVDTLLHINDLEGDNTQRLLKSWIQGDTKSLTPNNEGSSFIRASSVTMKQKIMSDLDKETISILKNVYSRDYELLKKVVRV